MACNTRPSIRAQEAEAEVWEFVSDYLKNPDRIREGLDQTIEEELKGRRGDPEQETKAWFAKQAHVDRKRERCQEMAASDLITFAELSARLAELEETRKVAEQELSDLTYRKERISQLEGDKTELLKSFGSVVPERVDAIKGEKRHRIYRQLRLKKVAVGAGGQLEEAQGVFVERVCTNEHTHPDVEPARVAGRSGKAKRRFWSPLYLLQRLLYILDYVLGVLYPQGYPDQVLAYPEARPTRWGEFSVGGRRRVYRQSVDVSEARGPDAQL